MPMPQTEYTPYKKAIRADAIRISPLNIKAADKMSAANLGGYQFFDYCSVVADLEITYNAFANTLSVSDSAIYFARL